MRLPALAAHAAIDVTSAFANEVGLTPEKRNLFTVINLVIVVAYTLILMKTLPKKDALSSGGTATIT